MTGKHNDKMMVLLLFGCFVFLSSILNIRMFPAIDQGLLTNILHTL